MDSSQVLEVLTENSGQRFEAEHEGGDDAIATAFFARLINPPMIVRQTGPVKVVAFQVVPGADMEELAGVLAGKISAIRVCVTA